ncbi:MAG: glycosyltransferase family 39 protein [Bacteroidota bacterium]
MEKLRSNPWLTRTSLGLFAIIIYFPIFLHLDYGGLKNFDEGYFSLRAFGMAHYGEYICQYADMPESDSGVNTKPPLFTWVQASFFHILGYNELAFRLPIALMVVALVALMLLFSKDLTGKLTWGYLSVLIMLTTPGMMKTHVARSGEHDLPFIFFIILQIVSFYLYLHSDLKDKKYLFWLGVGLILATWTKSAMALFTIPAFFLYALSERKLLPLLRDKHTWGLIGAYLLAVGGLYLYLSTQCPDFLSKVWRNDIVVRYSEVMDGHEHSWHWYVSLILPRDYLYWIPFTVVGIGIIFWKRDEMLPLFKLLGIVCIVWLTIIITAQTKLEWYICALYPLLGWMAGYGLWKIWEVILNQLQWTDGWKARLTGWLLLAAVFAYPYYTVIDNVYFSDWFSGEPERYAHLMQQVAERSPDIQDYDVLYEGWNFHASFYILVYNETKGYDIRRLRKREQLQVPAYVMVSQPGLIAYLKETYQWEALHAREGAELLKLTPLTQAKETTIEGTQ